MHRVCIHMQAGWLPLSSLRMLARRRPVMRRSVLTPPSGRQTSTPVSI